MVADSHKIYHRLEQYRSRDGQPGFGHDVADGHLGGALRGDGIGIFRADICRADNMDGIDWSDHSRYDVSSLADRFGVVVDPLKTGPLKDSLNPFRKLSDQDRVVWKGILDDAFDRFIGVIVDNRPRLDEALVRELATGQIYTAGQALGHGLVDEIGYEDDAIESLKDQLKLESVHVVTYRVRPGWIDLLLDQVESRDPEQQLAKWLETGVPRGMYLSSWGALPPSPLQ